MACHSDPRLLPTYVIEAHFDLLDRRGSADETPARNALGLLSPATRDPACHSLGIPKNLRKHNEIATFCVKFLKSVDLVDGFIKD